MEEEIESKECEFIPTKKVKDILNKLPIGSEEEFINRAIRLYYERHKY